LPADNGKRASEKTGGGSAQKTALALTSQGSAALAACAKALRSLPGSLNEESAAERMRPAPPAEL